MSFDAFVVLVVFSCCLSSWFFPFSRPWSTFKISMCVKALLLKKRSLELQQFAWWKHGFVIISDAAVVSLVFMSLHSSPINTTKKRVREQRGRENKRNIQRRKSYFSTNTRQYIVRRHIHTSLGKWKQNQIFSGIISVFHAIFFCPVYRANFFHPIFPSLKSIGNNCIHPFIKS